MVLETFSQTTFGLGVNRRRLRHALQAVELGKSTRLLVVSGIIALWFAAGFPSPGFGDGAGAAFASTTPLCSGNNFVGGLVGKNGAAGTAMFELAFINDGHGTCRLAGYPTIQGYRSGHEYDLVAGHLKNRAFHISPTTVGPRMSGEMYLTTEAGCNALNTGSRTAIDKIIAKNTYAVSVKFRNSNHPIYIYGLTIDVACGLQLTGLGWQ